MLYISWTSDVKNVIHTEQMDLKLEFLSCEFHYNEEVTNTDLNIPVFLFIFCRVTYKKTQWHLATAIHMTIQNSEGM
jgi:hypothetical protein